MRWLRGRRRSREQQAVIAHVAKASIVKASIVKASIVRELEADLRILAALRARVFVNSHRPFEERARGMPGAQCTRSLVCAYW
jgi:hypothetical protein